MITVTQDRPWLTAELPRAMRCLGWAPVGGGLRMASQVVWREVRNADLHPGFDVDHWFSAEMQRRAPGGIGMLTSRNVERWCLAQAEVEGIRAAALVTAGLSNAESVGTRLPWHPAEYGTINLLVAVDAGLTEVAQLEALAIAVQARTAAVIAAGIELATGTATGTGTDCVVLACDAGDLRYAGLHTALGEAIGAATRQAVAKAVGDWQGWLRGERVRRGIDLE